MTDATGDHTHDEQDVETSNAGADPRYKRWTTGLSEEFTRLAAARDPRIIWRDHTGKIVEPPPPHSN